MNIVELIVSLYSCHSDECFRFMKRFPSFLNQAMTCISIFLLNSLVFSAAGPLTTT